MRFYRELKWFLVSRFYEWKIRANRYFIWGKRIIKKNEAYIKYDDGCILTRANGIEMDIQFLEVLFRHVNEEE